MSLENNLSIARRFFNECRNQGNLDVLDEIMAPEHIHHLPDEDIHGSEKIKRLINNLRTAFPDMNIKIEDEIVEKDKVVFRWTARLTHRGDFFGIPPTGNHIMYSGIDIIRITNNRIVELWSQMDQVGFNHQLTKL
jgi:predicted ester cyclase